MRPDRLRGRAYNPLGHDAGSLVGDLMKNRVLFACALALVAVLVAGCGTAVPDLAGKPVGEATATLEAGGFKPGRISYDENVTSTVGTVVSQEPSAGVRTPAGSVVNLTVAGAAPVLAPNVVGMVEIPARMALVDSGLIVAGVSFVYDKAVPSGSVVAQEPVAGTEVPKGSGVALVLSRGPLPVAVPDVLGTTQAQAERALKAAGFRVKVSKKSDSAAKGRVIGQKPRKAKAAPGSVVAITVSTGVAMVRVPDIEGMIDPAPALRRVGLRPVGIAVHGPIESDAAGIGEAYRQRPRPGDWVPKGSKVTYHFWWESQ